MALEDLFNLPDWDDDNFDDEDDDGDEWKDKPRKEIAKALYKQWQQVFSLLQALLAVVEPNELGEDYLEDEKSMLRTDAMQVGAKIRGAEAGSLYVLRMENAAVIRAAANNIYMAMANFRMLDIADDEYTEALRHEIDIFRELFKEWVNSFEKDDFEDEWGLFK